MSKLRNCILAATMMSFVAVSPAMAQAPNKDSHGLGVYISNIAGSGLTYKRNFPNGFGFHLSGFATGQGSQGFYNFGGALTMDINRQEYGNLYGLLAVGYGVSLSSAFSGMSGSSTIESNIAPGVGYQYGPLMVEVGYSLYPKGGTIGYGPAGGIGLLWNF